MRIDVKEVRNGKYLQFVDSEGKIFHIGSALDFDSWLVSAILWNKEWRKEFAQRRQEFFDLFEYKMRKCVPLDSSEIQAFEAVRLRDERFSEDLSKPLRVPKIDLFGHMVENSNVSQRRFRRFIWSPTERGAQIQKRLNEIQFKERHFQRKGKDSKRLTEKRKKLEEIRTQRNRARESFIREANPVLSVLIEMEQKTGIVAKKELMNELTRRHKTSQEENEQTLSRLLREGTVYEPMKGLLKKT
jgi:hypothetical protein